MDDPKIIAAFVTGGTIAVHRQVSPDTLEAISIAPDDPRWLRAAEAVAHFAASDDPLPDLTE